MHGSLLLLTAACRRRSRNSVRVYLDFAELDISAGTVTAAGHQVRETDFIDFAQIRIRYPDFVIRIRRDLSHVYRHHTLRIEFDPADVRQREFAECQLRD